MRYDRRVGNMEAILRSEKPDIIPGTDVIFTGQDAGEASASEIVLIPQPTSGSDDPLVSSNPQFMPYLPTYLPT